MNGTELRRPAGGWCGALIDLDGTLVDTLGDFELALREAFQELGVTPVSRAFIARTIGKGSEHLIRSALAEAGAETALYEAAWMAYQRHYLAVNGRCAEVYPGTHEGLQALRGAGLRLVCLTNKPGRFARELLARKALDGYFEQVYGGDAFERRKPDPLPLQRACAALGMAPQDVPMVGDSSNDAQAGRAAGCPVVLLRHGYNHGEPLEQAGADALIERLTDLPTLLGLIGPGRS